MEIWKSGTTNKTTDGQDVVVIHGITKRGTMTEYFNAMMVAAQSGLIPGLDPVQIAATRNQYNQFRHEKYDMQMGLTVARHATEALAVEALENLDLTRTRTIGGRNLTEIFSDPRIAAHLNPEQMKIMADLPALMAKMQNEMKKTTGNRYYQGELLDCPAMFLEIDNPGYKSNIKAKPAVKGNSKALRGGGGRDTYIKKKPGKTPPPRAITTCLGLRMRNMLVTGSMIGSIHTLPRRERVYHSLTKHNTKIEMVIIDGKAFKTTHILPVDSTLGAEGDMPTVKKLLGYGQVCAGSAKNN